MGAARHTQRAQEQAQRRVARGNPAYHYFNQELTPEDLNRELEIARRICETGGDWSALVEATNATRFYSEHEYKALEAERDRLREERDAIARAAAKAGDVLEQVIRDRDRWRSSVYEARPVLDAVGEWFAGRGEDYTRHHEQELIAAYSRYRDRAGWGA